MGIITLAFDDGYRETFKACAKYLTEKGLRATFAVPSSRIGKELENRTVTRKEDISYLIKNGHEIASHTSSHRNLLDVFNSEGEQAVKKEMEDSKNELERSFGIEINSMVFPFIKNNQNEHLRKLASNYYKSSRITTETARFNSIPIKDPFSVIGVALTTHVSIEAYNKMAEIAHEKNVWLIEVFHLVSDKNTKSAHRDEPYRFFTHTSDFRSHIEYILSKKIPVFTQNEVIFKSGIID
jgi:peptidoglycan/xylan/chitin deacetylase (PgdA/CDA1 family)